mgnify:CR=1 FL=1
MAHGPAHQISEETVAAAERARRCCEFLGKGSAEILVFDLG